MARRAFFSFHYKPDSWRVSQIRNMGVIEGNRPATDNDWETITSRGDAAIERWINEQMVGTSCAVVLIGANTAGRKWINYEIKKAWNDNKGVLGVYIHNLEEQNGKQSAKGGNPFDLYNGSKLLSSVLKVYDPPYSTSKSVYNYIKENLAGWLEESIDIRKRY